MDRLGRRCALSGDLVMKWRLGLGGVVPCPGLLYVTVIYRPPIRCLQPQVSSEDPRTATCTP